MMMKAKYFLVVMILATLTACSVDDMNEYNYQLELAPVTEVAIPDTLQQGQTYSFEISYQQASTCHYFSGFRPEQYQQEIIIGVVNNVIQEASCETLTDSIVTRNLDFRTQRSDYYRFKFWKGIDSIGNPVYLTKEVPVKVTAE